MAIKDRFAQVFNNARTRDRVQNNLGIIHAPGTVRRYRLDYLNQLDMYYDGTQYDGLIDWEEANCSSEYIPIRKRRPRIQFRLAYRMAEELASKLFGEKVAPTFQVEDDPETTYFLRLVVKSSRFRMKMRSMVKKAAVGGSCFVRFYFVNGRPILECYDTKWCYPELDAAGDLKQIMIRWTWKDTMDIDETGKPTEKWGQLLLTKNKDVLYDTPEVESGSEPYFTEIGAVEHNLGFVQGEWFRTTEELGTPDGQSIIEPAIPFFTEMDYNASQSSQAIGYNQDPIPWVQGMDMDSVSELIRSSAQAWNLGRDGSVGMLESNMAAAQRASEFRDDILQGIQDVTRILLMDPEKIKGNAQSGRALEILHGPLMDIIYTLREAFEPNIVALLTKISTVAYMLGKAGQGIVQVPPGWTPASLDSEAVWPDVFPETIEDLQKRVATASSATSANIISRESATRWLAESFNIEDIEAEMAKIDSQPILNPFGGF